MEYNLAVFDLETDPFKYGRVPKAFAAGFFDGETYRTFWGANCVRDFINFLHQQKQPYKIYAHNGGKFDFFYLVEQEALENPIKLINSRIVSAKIGCHELRDSYAIIPLPLATYQKTEIDYDKFESHRREIHKDEILSYLRDDLRDTFEIVKKFRDRFGDKLTIGGTAIEKLAEFHPFDSQGESHDIRLRPFYYGGRVQAFKPGVHRGKRFKVFDVNSMYPYVMANMLHPHGKAYTESTDMRYLKSKPDNWPFFIELECNSRGAFPQREYNGAGTPVALHFPEGQGQFAVTGHEYRTAKRLGLISDEKIERVLVPRRVISFPDYVETFGNEKVAAKNSGDKASEIFAKLLLNSAYGKFAQSPETYKDYYIRYPGMPRPEGTDWFPELYYGELELWSKPSKFQRYYDVAIAASITGGARAVLLDGIANAENVYYCDTDSLICEEFHGKRHKSRLGAWDLEGEGNHLAVAGKKLYALRDGHKEIKKASKGAKLTATDIFLVAGGAPIEWKNDAPTFRLGADPGFISRIVQRTIN